MNEYYCVTCHAAIYTIAENVEYVDMHMVYFVHYTYIGTICSFCANPVLYTLVCLV